MIFLALFGGLMLILSGFYLANSWMEYHEWKWATLLVIASLAMTVIGVVKLPYWHHSSNNAASSSSQPTSPKQRAAANSGSLQQFANQMSIAGGNTASQEQKESAVLRQLQKAYSKLGTVSFDSADKTFKVTPTNDEMKQALSQLSQRPDQADQMGWPKFTKSIRETSSQLDNVLGNGYSISLLNPSDDSKALYTAKDGKTTFDIANQ
ncbi:DUF308 domain-containing protein [uncultured Limosilactobacillus sp.]|uniref:DUF308 domain-containing protein n=1 Tax=uncultured Limosilactobacillus sp. TaxID=2837629 RepID=UPI0025F89BF3|nr:DUF308 domain-containing protein [uncultured Limosilactobacillus sp.]